MRAFFDRLQNSEFSAWFLGSESIWAYPTVLTLHTIGLAILVGASVVIHLRTLGVGPAVPFPSLSRLFRFVWTGFFINLASGLILFISAAADKASQPIFLVKLTAIAVALALGQTVKRRVYDTSDGTLTAGVGTKALSAAGLGSWVVAMVAGRLMAYMD